MRMLLKILLFPVILVLSIAVATSRFLCDFSGALLSILSAIIFLIAVLALLILKDPLAALCRNYCFCYQPPWNTKTG